MGDDQTDPKSRIAELLQHAYRKMYEALVNWLIHLAVNPGRQLFIPFLQSKVCFWIFEQPLRVGHLDNLHGHIVTDFPAVQNSASDPCLQ